MQRARPLHDLHRYGKNWRRVKFQYKRVPYFYSLTLSLYIMDSHSPFVLFFYPFLFILVHLVQFIKQEKGTIKKNKKKSLLQSNKFILNVRLEKI